MAGLWQKTLYYLGLVDDEDGSEEMAPSAVVTTEAPVTPSPAPPRSRGVRHVGAPTAVIPGERVEPPPRSRRRISAEPSLAEAGVYVEYGEVDRPTVSAGSGETEIIVANAFSDAQLLADLIRDRTPVVLDLRGTEPEMVRRLVDFASGLTYALDGTMRKVAQGVILVTPPRVTVSRDERRRLAEYGLYQATDAG